MKKWLPVVLITVLALLLLGMNFYEVHSKSSNPKSGRTHLEASNMPFFKKEKEPEKSYPVHFRRPKQVLLDAPLIKQFPELPRGCEVTSLAMLLQFAGYDVDKMELEKKIKKDPTPYQVIHGQVHFGNPNIGFVGAMDTYDEPGLGVYHGPVAVLAGSYMGDRIIDLTGDSFDAVLDQLADGIPVWVINNTHFTRLPKEFWETWQTPEGPIQITYKEHAVLVTGYDQNWIYFNDPLVGVKNRKMRRTSFIEGWKQMGNQAISYRAKEE